MIPEGATLSDSALRKLQKMETQMSLALFEVAKKLNDGFEKAMLAMIESKLSGATSSGYAKPKTVGEAQNWFDWKQ